MIIIRPSNWHRSSCKDDSRIIVRILMILLVIIVWALATNAGFAAERLCGARSYFPPQTILTAFVENGEILSKFEMVLTDRLVLKPVPAELEPLFASLNAANSQKVEIESKQTILLRYPEVLKASGTMALKPRGSIMLQQDNNYYLLEHSLQDQHADLEIAAVLRPGKDGVIVELNPSETGSDKLALEIEKNTAGKGSVSLLPGTKISVPVNRPNKFQISLTNGEFLYDYVDFFHRAKLDIKEPIRTPPRGKFIAEIRKQGVEFKGREFMACVRPADPRLGREFFQIKDIEVLDLKSGQAQLALSLPHSIRDIKGFQWDSLGTPIELQIHSIKKNKNSDDVIMAEQRYYVGSRQRALIIAIGVTLVLYIAPLWFLRSQRRANSSDGKGLNLGPYTIFSNRSTYASKEALTAIKPVNVRRPFFFSPIWLGRTRRGNASLSSLQITIWTYLVFCIASYVFILNGELINITSSILILLGISGSSSVAARVTSARQDERAELITAVKSDGGDDQSLSVVSYPSWSNLISSGGRVDLARLQMLVFTILTAAYVGITAFVTFQFPEIPEGLLWLMGISNGVYLGGKISEPSLANRLSDIELERRAVDSDLPVKKKIADDAKARLEQKQEELKEIDKKIAAVKSKGKDTADLVVRQNALQAEVNQLETDWSAADSQYKKTLETSQKLAKDYKDVVNNLNKAIDKEAGVTT